MPTHSILGLEARFLRPDAHSQNTIQAPKVPSTFSGACEPFPQWHRGQPCLGWAEGQLALG